MDKSKYQKIYEELRKQIFTGTLAPGDMLPSENVLAAKYKTSRVTIRKSLGLLENEHIIHSEHGKGYFVNKPEHQHYTLIYSDQLIQQGCRIRYINLIAPNEEIRSALNCASGQRVVSITRTLRNNDGTAVCDQVFVPYRKGMPLVEQEIRYAEFHSFLYDKVPEYSVSTRMEIGFEPVNSEIASYLEVPEGTTVLVVYRFLLDSSASAIIYGKQYLHPRLGRIAAYSGYSSEC